MQAGPSTETVNVQAGSTIGFVADTVVSHPGPFTAYLAKAPGDVKDFTADGQVWFKIWDKGATSISSSGMVWDDSKISRCLVWF